MTKAQDGGKVVSLTHRPPLPPGNTPGTHFFQRLNRPQGHSAIGMIMSMKNSNDIIWDRTNDLPICSIEHLPLCYLGPHVCVCVYIYTHTSASCQLGAMLESFAQKIFGVL